MTSSPLSPRLRRIRIVSRFFMGLFLIWLALETAQLAVAAYLLVTTGSILPADPELGLSPDLRGEIDVVIVVTTGLSIAAAWFGFRLFRLYERGVFFAAENGGLLRRLAWLYLALVVTRFPLDRLPKHIHVGIVLPPWAELAFHFLPALFFLFLAWVMDEGRKIREEQELTV